MKHVESSSDVQRPLLFVMLLHNGVDVRFNVFGNYIEKRRIGIGIDEGDNTWMVIGEGLKNVYFTIV